MPVSYSLIGFFLPIFNNHQWFKIKKKIFLIKLTISQKLKSYLDIKFYIYTCNLKKIVTYGPGLEQKRKNLVVHDQDQMASNHGPVKIFQNPEIIVHCISVLLDLLFILPMNGNIYFTLNRCRDKKVSFFNGNSFLFFLSFF